MANKTSIKIGHLKITDHLILGITKLKHDQGAETFSHAALETQAMMGWNQVADALAGGAINAAFVLAPTAMDLYKAGVKIKLVLFTHKTGSVLITNKKAGIKSLDDFKDRVVIIPYQLSVHNMLLHKMLTEHGLKPGTGRDPNVDVKLEVMAPSQMPEAIQFDEEGEIAGFIVAEPFGSQAVLAGFGEEFALSKNLWPNHPCCVLVMKEELTEGNPEACVGTGQVAPGLGDLCGEESPRRGHPGRALPGPKGGRGKEGSYHGPDQDRRAVPGDRGPGHNAGLHDRPDGHPQIQNRSGKIRGFQVRQGGRGQIGLVHAADREQNGPYTVFWVIQTTRCPSNEYVVTGAGVFTQLFVAGTR